MRVNSIVRLPVQFRLDHQPNHWGSKAQKWQPGSTLARRLPTRRLATPQAVQQKVGLSGVDEYVTGLYPELEVRSPLSRPYKPQSQYGDR